MDLRPQAEGLFELSRLSQGFRLQQHLGLTDLSNWASSSDPLDPGGVGRVKFGGSPIGMR
jgi:hypothetical protein